MDTVVSEERVALFCSRLEKRNASQNTMQKYSRDLRKLQRYLQGRELTQERLECYKTWLLEGQHFKEASVNSYLTVVNRFCEEMGWGMRCLVIKPSAAEEPEELKGSAGLTYGEYVRLVRTSLGMGMNRLAMLIQVLANTDLRVGEVSCLRVEHLEDGKVPVMRKGRVYYVVLPDILLPALRQYGEQVCITGGVLFRTSTGMAVNRSNLWREMKRLGKLAGVEESKLSVRGIKQPFLAEVFPVGEGG